MLTLSEIEKRFSRYMDGIRVVMLINRKIGNSNKGSKRWINKIISTNKEEWLLAVQNLLELQCYLNDPAIRLYGCINSRKLDNAIKIFKHKQIELQENMKEQFYSRINNSFCSCLMKPENRLTKYFLLDIDTKYTKEVDKFISDHLIQVVDTYPTRSGWHYIVEPFNIKLSNGYESFTVIKDGLLLLNYLEDYINA